MAKMLCRNLTLAEQSALANMAQHPGFDVLTKLYEEYCMIAASEILRLNPADPRYDELLKTAALTARITNDVVESLRKSVNTHISSAAEELHQKELDEQIERETEQLMGTIRLLSRDDNTE